MQDVMPPGGTLFCGCTQLLWATEVEDAALEELLATADVADEVPALEELLGEEATTEEEETTVTGLEEELPELFKLLELLGLLGLPESPGSSGGTGLHSSLHSEPPPVLHCGLFLSSEQAKRTTPIAHASNNKIPDAFFMLSPKIYLSILMGK